MKSIGIIGCGWLGLHLANHLSMRYRIYTTTTTEDKKNKLTANGYHATCIIFPDDDVVPNTSPWTAYKSLDAVVISVPFAKRSDSQALHNRFENISRFIPDFDNQLFLMSSIGIYPQIDRRIDENSLEDSDLNPGILSVEKLVRNRFPQTNILRLGGLMGGNRQLSNYKVSTPNSAVNHVHYLDVCCIIEKMIKRKSNAAIFNIVAPLHPSKQEIIDYQKGQKSNIKGDLTNQVPGRIILSQLSEQVLNYQYRYPNPKLFK